MDNVVELSARGSSDPLDLSLAGLGTRRACDRGSTDWSWWIESVRTDRLGFAGSRC